MPQVWQLGGYDPMAVDQARSQNRLNKLKVQQAESGMAREEKARNALGNLYQPTTERRLTNPNALRPGPGGMASGGRAGPSQNMLGRATSEVQTGQEFNPEAMAELMAADPELGAKMQTLRAQQSEVQREQEDREAAMAAHLFDRVESLPEEQRQEGYRRLLDFATRQGVDTSDWPSQYTPGFGTISRVRAQAAGQYEPVQGQERAEVMSGADLGLTGDAATKQYEVKRAADGSISDINSLGGGGVTVNTGATQGKFAEEVGKKSAERWNEVISGGDRAAQSEIMVDRMTELLSGGDINTGILQPALTTLQAVGQDLGFDVDATAQDIGLRLGDLSSKEEFERLSKTLTMKALQGFKGNTSNKELQFAREQVARLGQSEGGNLRALAAMKAMNQVARENAERASDITNQQEWAQFERQRLNRGAERVKELTDMYEEQLEERVQEQPSFEQTGQTQPVDQPVGQPPQISSDAEYQQLEPGTVFIDPEGVRRRKPEAE